MLIGNRAHLGFDIIPVTPSWDRRYEPEAAAWAGLAIWVKNQNLCKHVREGEESVRTHFFVPLAPIADWLVRAYPGLALEERAPFLQITPNLHQVVREWGTLPPPRAMDEDSWLDARVEFWSRHFLCAGAEGARLPNLAFLRQDNDLLVCWCPPQFIGEPQIRMVTECGNETLRWNEAEATLSQFVEFVAATFQEAGTFPFAWMKSEPRLSMGITAKDKLALFCARSVDQLAELLQVAVDNLSAVLGLQDSEDDPTASPGCQIIRDLSPAPSSGIGPELLALVSQAREQKLPPRSPWRIFRDMLHDAARAGKTPEEQGQLAAQTLRSQLGMNGQPIVDLPSILGKCGVVQRGSSLSTKEERMIVAAVAEGQPTFAVMRNPRTEKPWGMRFEQARALGHVMLDPERGGAIGAAGTSYAQQDRRRRSGAFAAEFLLPESALEKASGGRLNGGAEPLAFESLLETYGVGATTAAHQLYNHNWISHPSIRDELIEEYSRRV